MSRYPILRLSLVLLAVVLASGCAKPYARTSRVLGSVGAVVYSNSPVVIERREPERTHAGLEVSYSVLVANHEPFAVALALSQARATADTQVDTAVAHCRLGSRAEGADATLQPGERAHIQCRLQLTSQGAARLDQGDLDLHLLIPILIPNNNIDLHFVYSLRMEDAA